MSGMKLSNNQIEVMIQRIFKFWKAKNIATFKEDEKKVFLRAIDVIRQEFDAEKQIEQEAKAMVDQLERQNASGSFEPHKMFLMIKKKIAKDKGVIL